MDEYNFAGLNSMIDNGRVSSLSAKRRNSLTRNTKLPIELDAAFLNEFMRELAVMKIKYPFLTQSQIQGRTLDKFCIPNLMGKPYKKHKSGAVTMCTIHYAIQTVKKSLSEKKIHSGRTKIGNQRRHTIHGSYFPIDITINKSIGSRNSKVSKKLFDNFTLYSENMEDDNYSIQESDTDDSGLENFNPEIQNHTFELNFMNKPNEEIKPMKTYEKVKLCTSYSNGLSKKKEQCYQQGNSNKSTEDSSKFLKALVVPEGEISKINLTSDQDVDELDDVNEDLQSNIATDGDIVENSVGTIDGASHFDESQKMLSESAQQNTSISFVSEGSGIRNKTVFISSDMPKRRKKVSISNQQVKGKVNHHSHGKKNKQSISQVSLEYLENISADSSLSTIDGNDFNPGYLCGVMCLLTPRPQMPLIKVNLSVFSQNKEPLNNSQELTKGKELTRPLNPISKLKKYRKCSESVPYSDSLHSSQSEKNSNSGESPMSEMNEEENESCCTPNSYGMRKSSCSSRESYTSRHNGRFSPHIIQMHSSQGTDSESPLEDCDVEEARNSNYSTTDDFGEIRGNFSPQNATIQHFTSNSSYTLSPSLLPQQSAQLSPRKINVTTAEETRSPVNTASSGSMDGYFLANLFDEYTDQPVRRTLRSLLDHHEEGDGAMIKE